MNTRQPSQTNDKADTQGPRWRTENGVIYLSVTSDGTTGEGWIDRLTAKGYRISRIAAHTLRSRHFNPSKGVTTEIAIFDGAICGDTGSYFPDAICQSKVKHRLTQPTHEVACLIRDAFTDDELMAMGVNDLVVMHQLTSNERGYDAWLAIGSAKGGEDRNQLFSFEQQAHPLRRGMSLAYAA